MLPVDINNWFGVTRVLDEWREKEGRPGSVAQMIADDPFSVVITRQDAVTQATTQLTAQTVRIAQRGTHGTEAFMRAGVGFTSRQQVVVLGYKNHPIVTDTDIRYGDRFAWNNKYYSVTLVEKDFPDRMIALGEAID